MYEYDAKFDRDLQLAKLSDSELHALAEENSMNNLNASFNEDLKTVGISWRSGTATFYPTERTYHLTPASLRRVRTWLMSNRY